MARQAEQQYTYEDRIAELRTRIERSTSRQLLDQEQFEQKLDDLMRRQIMLESRAAALIGVADPGATGSLRPMAHGGQDSVVNAPRARGRRSLVEPERAPPNSIAGGDDTRLVEALRRAVCNRERSAAL